MSNKTLVRTQQRKQLSSARQTPRRGKVIMLNDDYTPMEYVVMVLERFFHMNHQRAFMVMRQVHEQGSAVAGEYPLEIAEARADQVNRHARGNQHPLLCVVEKVTT